MKEARILFSNDQRFTEDIRYLTKDHVTQAAVARALEMLYGFIGDVNSDLQIATSQNYRLLIGKSVHDIVVANGLRTITGGYLLYSPEMRQNEWITTARYAINGETNGVHIFSSVNDEQKKVHIQVTNSTQVRSITLPFAPTEQEKSTFRFEKRPFVNVRECITHFTLLANSFRISEKQV